jgi:putative membrane protein
MYIKKNYGLTEAAFFNSGRHLAWLVPYTLLVAALYRYTALHRFSIPWLPLSLLGTAVTFYVGFKNNQAYDRLWEARTVWGGIVNSARTWGANLNAFVVPAADGTTTAAGLAEAMRALVYRQIAWLYLLRRQLLAPTAWEHVSQPGIYGQDARRKLRKIGLGLFGEDITQERLHRYLSAAEQAALPTHHNAAAQLIYRQSQQLARLRQAGQVGDIEHLALQAILNEFYEHQGKAERIKNTPFPRQFASVGFMMVCIFIGMLPFGFFSEFSKMGESGIWVAVPFVVLISWVYVLMELVGDYSENPFEGLSNDVPMLALSRTIEIDLLQQLGETELPAPIQPIQHVLL